MSLELATRTSPAPLPSPAWSIRRLVKPSTENPAAARVVTSSAKRADATWAVLSREKPSTCAERPSPSASDRYPPP